MILLLLAAQAAPVATLPTPAPTAFSILEPVGSEPCVRRGKDGKVNPDDIIVCGKPLPSQKLPYPNEVVLDEPRPSNPYLRGTGSLALESTPCSATQWGCGSQLDLIGAGVTAVRLVQKAISPDSCCEQPGEATSPLLLIKDAARGVGKAFRRKPDKSKRVAIALDGPPPTGTILP